MSRVAIIGCGVIAPVYARTLAALGSVELAAVADGVAEKASEFASQFNTTARTAEDIFADPTIDAVVNLTPPLAHAAVTRASLDAGKATFSEKPLGVDFAQGRALVELAATKSLRLGCAPDTFLGAGLQTARAAIDRGDIGEPLAATGFMLQGGPEWWHPGPEIFYQRGAGPMLDMGPYYLTALVQLLGPAASVSASARITRSQRTIHSKPRRGELLNVEVPTHVSSLIDFVSGATATLITSFDVHASRHRNIEIYGTDATLSVPDPNTFNGPVQIRAIRDREWRDIEMLEPNIPQERGIGLADMMWAQTTGRPHRASADLALHVLELMTSAVTASDRGERIALETSCERAKPMQFDLPNNTFDD